MKKGKIKLIITLIILTIFLGTYLVWKYERKNEKKVEKEAISLETNMSEIKVGIFYQKDGKDWKSDYSHLEQSMVSNIDIIPVDVESKNYEEDTYNIIYLDESINNITNKDSMKKFIEEFVKSGGGVFVENSLYNFFDKSFLGVKSFHKIKSYPEKIDFPEVEYNLGELQGTIKDFDYIYRDYKDFNKLRNKEYGYGSILKDAKSIANDGNLSLYSMNKIGKGHVFFTSPILPNKFHIDNYSMKSDDKTKKYFTNTSSAMNQMIKDKFISYISKEKNGYSLEKTFGAYGRPSMAWQLHYEEIEGINRKSGEIFEKIAKESLQIPSYTIVRNSYKWFTRYETITYLLNEGETSNSYKMNEYENAYSSGEHIVSDNRWMEIEKKENAGSYFQDLPEYDCRAYPFIKDINSDGKTDIISGSSNGRFYYFEGKGMDENYETLPKKEIKDIENKTLKVKGYSSPYLYDLNKDGIDDLISGSIDGKVYWFSGKGDLKYKNEGVLIDTKTNKQVTATIGKLTKEKEQIVIGGNNKEIKIYNFEYKNNLEISEENLEIEGLKNIKGDWISPFIFDIDKDGINDILFGTFDGYVGILEREGNIFKFQKYLEGTEKNYKENKRLKFGNYSTPFLEDINNDSKEDLIVGSFEYGLAYPIDSKYFPYRDTLQAQIDKMKEKGYYVGTHFYTNIGASSEYEKEELKMHNIALDSYGMVNEYGGFNQHTWNTSNESLTQTLKNGYEANMLWNSGFTPSRSKSIPQISAETAVTIPFYMKENEKIGDNLLVFNTGTLLYDEKNWGDIVSKYDLPISIYYHCDLIYIDTEKEKIENDIKKVEEFKTDKSYNFVTEEQYAKMISMAKNTKIYPVQSDNEIKFEKKVIDKNISLYDENYLDSVGLKIVLGEKYEGKKLNIESEIWQKNGNVIYLGIDKDSKIGELSNKKEEIRILRGNLPIEVTEEEENKKVINFREGGMMEIEVEGKVYTKSKGWIVTNNKDRDSTTFTKYGKPSEIEIRR